MELLLSAALM